MVSEANINSCMIFVFYNQNAGVMLSCPQLLFPMFRYLQITKNENDNDTDSK